MARAKTPRSINSSTKHVIPMPETSSTASARKNGGAAVPTPIDLEAQIRERAYAIFQERGNNPGSEQDDWIRAEREVRARYDHQHTGIA
jgi:Protein of unknown function (DUF2934)